MSDKQRPNHSTPQELQNSKYKLPQLKSPIPLKSLARAEDLKLDREINQKSYEMQEKEAFRPWRLFTVLRLVPFAKIVFLLAITSIMLSGYRSLFWNGAIVKEKLNSIPTDPIIMRDLEVLTDSGKATIEDLYGAIKRQGETNGADAFNIAKRYLSHPSPRIQSAAIYTLGKLVRSKDAKEATQLLTEAAKAPHPQIFEEVISALSAAPGQVKIDAYEDIYQFSKNPRSASETLRLIKIGNEYVKAMKQFDPTKLAKQLPNLIQDLKRHSRDSSLEISQALDRALLDLENKNRGLASTTETP